MSIREILTDLGYIVNGDGENYRCRPLYRNSSSSTVLSVNSKTGVFFDFARSTGGSLEELVRITLNFEDPKEAQNWLTNKEFHVVPAQSKTILKMPKTFDPENFFALPHKYFEDKGISAGTMKLFGHGLCMGGQMRTRYTFFIKNEHGEIVGVAGRLLYETKAYKEGKVGKWKILGNKANFLWPYFINRLDIERANELILVESIGDMLALWESGLKNSLVLFGTEISKTLLAKLIEINPKKIIVAANNDSDENSVGNRAADKIIAKLSKFFAREKVYNGVPANDKDLMSLFQKGGKTNILDWRTNTILE